MPVPSYSPLTNDPPVTPPNPQPSYLTLVSPKSTIFVLKGEQVTFKVESNAASVTMTIPSDKPIIRQMIKIGTTFTYTYTFSSTDFYYAQWIDSASSYSGLKQITFRTDTGLTASVDYAVLKRTRDYYSGMQPSLIWTSPTSTPFLAPATEEYNCLAFAIGIQNRWIAGNRNGGPEKDLKTVVDYMQGKGYTLCGTIENPDYSDTPKIIYYENYHFAKVVAWYNNGTPKTIHYKMGEDELIKAEGYNVFSKEFQVEHYSGAFPSYGKPVLCFK